MSAHPGDPNLDTPDSFGGSDYQRQQCGCIECDCDLLAPEGGRCIACRNGYCWTVPLGCERMP